MTDLLPMLLRGLDTLKTPILLLLLVLAVVCYMKLQRLEEQMKEQREAKADLKALNGVGAKLSRLDKEVGMESSKTRIAVAALAIKCDAPDVLKDFLKPGIPGAT
jgi:hypothetical protein